MAERQANINVNYNINTQSVAAAEQTVRRAQTATDQFQKSVAQTGTTFQRTSQQFLSNGQRIASTIDGQKVQMQQLRAQIELTRASDTKRLQQLTADYKTLKTNVDAFNKSLQTQQAQTQSLSQTFGGFITTVRAFLAAGLVKEVLETQLEMAKLAGRVEGVERAFQRLPMSTQLLNDLRKSTHGAVDDLELMQQALRANNFEIDLKKLGSLLEFAATRAQQTGQEVDYLVNSIVMGIGMKSILRLDNLGLSATRLKEELGGVSVRSASVAEITRVVAKVAEESNKKLGGYFETSATKVQQLTVAWKDFKKELAENIGSGEFASFWKSYLNSLADALEAYRRNISAEELYQERAVKSEAVILDNVFAKTKLTDSVEENIKITEAEIRQITKDLGIWSQYRTSIENTIKTKEAELKADVEVNKVYGQSTVALRERIKGNRESIAVYKEHIETTKASNGWDKETVIVYQEVLKLMNERLNALKLEQEELGKGGKQLGLVEEYLDRIQTLEENIEKARKSSWSGTQKEIQGYQDEIQKTQKQLDLLLGTYNDFAKLKLGSDTNIGGIQIKPLTAPIKNFQVKTETIDELTERLNKRFKENPPEIPTPEFIQSNSTAENWRAFWEDDGKMESFFQAGQAMHQNFLDATVWAEVDAYDMRIKAAEQFYDRQLELAGEKYTERTEAEKQRDKELNKIEEERARTVDRLRKQQAEKEKKARRTEVTVNIAAGIAKAFATSTFYEALFQSAIIAGVGLTQLNAIDRAPLNFAKGVIDLKGKGTETSDSIPANLSRGESVMTAKETRNSLGILKSIRANKLDDRVLEQIKSGKSGGSQMVFNDDRIVKAIEKQKYPDVIEQSGVVYKVYEKGKNYRMKVRAKSMGNDL